MRLSRDKVNKLASLTTEQLADMQRIDFLEAGTTTFARNSAASSNSSSRTRKPSTRPPAPKIENQSAPSWKAVQEWDILYRKYYNEEVKKLGI